MRSMLGLSKLICMMLLICLPNRNMVASQDSADLLIHQAQDAFKQALTSNDYLERNHAFNLALSKFLEAERQLNNPSSQLNEAIGNVFYQLGEFPLTILYYERALNEEPGNQTIKDALKVIRATLKLPEEKISFFEKFNPQAYLSFSQVEMIFFWILFALLTATLFWFASPHIWLKRLIFSLSGLSCVAFLYLLYAFYFSPIFGIVIESTGIYESPDYRANLIAKVPILAGTKIEVLESLQGGKWLKIRDHSGHIGYVYFHSARLV